MTFERKLIIAICVAAMAAAILLMSWTAANADEPKKENLFAKYFFTAALPFSNFCEGLDQAWFFNGEASNWSGYSKANSHAWYFARRSSQVLSVLAASQWHPKSKLISGRMLFRYSYLTCLQSWALNRGLRLVQTGQLFPPERGHAWYIDFGWLRLEVQGQDWIQWGSLGYGVLGVIIDEMWD